jgi:co-chaperonin GroES (HSP10)
MLTPVNGHILIEPLVHESFIASDKGTFEEIGRVLHRGDILDVNVGDKVYFDSWLAAKFPKNDTESYWLVKWEDVRAVDA